MRFLADVGVSNSTIAALRDAGHDAVHVGELGLSRASDSHILNRAHDEGRTVLTFDLDFGDLMATGGGALPSVIILRMRNQTPHSVTPAIMSLLNERAADISTGALAIIEEGRYRIRPLPLDIE